MPDVSRPSQLQAGRIAHPQTEDTTSSQDATLFRHILGPTQSISPVEAAEPQVVMSFAMVIGAATSRVRGQAARAARQRVAARTAVSPPDRTLLVLLALYACWGSASPAIKLMVDTVPPLGGAALVFLVAGLVLRPRRRCGSRPGSAASRSWC